MKIEFDPEFMVTLIKQIETIAEDKPSAAREFKQMLIAQCKSLVDMPYRCRKSIYYDDDNVRDLIFKGYVIVYVIQDDMITITSLINQQNFKPKSI
ncbi:type II toxin-antitoxin system RelE/ParE family toxin [Sulfuricurvum sp.]|uniref:type II toxin-antitoxin system RelE/ParE family toxin n=1 Tax=Sulfuricurvum sp. TaxID=2025608 RepID=UPI00286E435C|nr:type II toxin-antitoxin system RelE/ParE family toxin [Sulfuricurvum sp.]